MYSLLATGRGATADPLLGQDPCPEEATFSAAGQGPREAPTLSDCWEDPAPG